MIVTYCPNCGMQLETEEYNNPKVRYCTECGTVFEILERRKIVRPGDERD